MKQKKAVLLFEITFVALLIAIFSVFLFRGYSLFLKTGRKSLDYFKLIMLSEEKIWGLQLKERNNKLTENFEDEGYFSIPFYSWRIDLEDIADKETTEDTTDETLKRAIVKVQYNDKRKLSFNTIIYLHIEEK